MREIKFRFWHSQRGVMAQWEDAKKECNRLSLLELPEFIPMQYTGLKDKNEVEIYEGDIVRIQYSSGDYFDAVVRWYAGNPHSCDGEYGVETATWVLNKYADEGKDCLLAMYHLACQDVRTVIGNEHQNPELLEAKS